MRTHSKESGGDVAVVRMDSNNSDGIRVAVRGRLDAAARARIWKELFAAASGAATGPIVVDLQDLEWCDAGGAVILTELERQQGLAGRKVTFRGANASLTELLNLVRPRPAAPKAEPSRRGLFERLGRRAVEYGTDFRRNVAFVGHVTLELLYAIRHPRALRVADVFRVAETVGIGAIPIVALVGSLLGLILAFQSVISMNRFGAEIYMADLLAISMVRELGPLMGAILLAARSGSAFAAEIGTMKINEEVDALTTMGFEPVRFLIVPRVIAALGMTPIVALLTNLFGLLGGLVVWLSIGYPAITFVKRAAAAATMTDLFGGLGKALIFGIIVAAVGCLRGLETRTGAGAVGESTTSSVVTCIVLIGVADGVFAIMFYILGI